MKHLFLSLAICFFSIPTFAKYFPGDSWERSTASKENVNQSRLKALEKIAFTDPATQALVVVKNGKIISERYAKNYNKDSYGTSWSVAKSFYAALIGISIEKGEINSLDDPVYMYLPIYEKDERSVITLRNILDMESGLQYPETQHEAMFLHEDQLQYSLDIPLEKKPGAQWEYNNVNSMLLAAILKAATGKAADELLQERILKPIGIKETTLWKDGKGNVMTYCCIDMSARDFSRFGLLFARNGNWNNQSLVPKAFIDQTFNTSWRFEAPRSGGYSLHWWMAVDNENHEIFFASGKFGQYIFVDRNNDVVVTKITKYDPIPGDTQDFKDFKWLKEIGDTDVTLAVWDFLERSGIMQVGEGGVASPITKEYGDESSFRKDLYKFIENLVLLSN